MNITKTDNVIIGYKGNTLYLNKYMRKEDNILYACILLPEISYNIGRGMKSFPLDFSLSI